MKPSIQNWLSAETNSALYQARLRELSRPRPRLRRLGEPTPNAMFTVGLVAGTTDPTNLGDGDDDHHDQGDRGNAERRQ